MKIIFFGFIIRFFLSIINIYFFSLPGGEYDAGSFHLKAIEYTKFLEDGNSFHDYSITFGWIYSVFLGYIYYFFGISELLGSFLSCVAWLLSAIVLREIMLKLNYKINFINTSLIIYCFIFPSSLIYSVFTLREAYLLLFSNLLFLLIVNLFFSKNFKLKILNTIFFIIVSIVLFYFHKAGAIFIGSLILLIIPIMILFHFDYQKKKIKLLSITVIFLSFFIFEYLGIFEQIFSRINSYQSGHFEEFENFRAHYYEKNEIIFRDYTLTNFFVLILENNLNYFFQPTIFKASNIKDLVVLSENNLRVVFLIVIFYKVFSNFENKNLYLILFLMFIFMETIYAQATVNYGTASRHHMTSLGYLVLLLFFPVNQKINKDENKK